MAETFTYDEAIGSPNGLVHPGNVDLYAQPEVRNPDGSISTVDSLGVNFDGFEVLIPQVTPDGRHLQPKDAIEEYKKTGRHLGKFDTPENATAYAIKLHDDYAAGVYRQRQAPETFSYEDAVRGREPRADQSFMRGVVNSPARMVQGIGALAGRPGRLISDIGDTVAQRSEAVADRYAPRPTQPLGKFMERMGEQAVPTVGGMAVAGATGGLPALLGEGALALSTPVVGMGLEGLGATPRQAALGEVVFNMVAPSVAVRALRAAGYRGDMQPGLHDLTARRQARGMVPVDQTGQGRWHEQAADLLEDEVLRNPNPLNQRTSEMILSDDAPNFENLAIRKAQTDPRFQGVIGGRKMNLEAIQDQRVRTALGGAKTEPLPAIKSKWKQAYGSVKAKNADIWKSLDLKGAEPASDSFLRGAIDDITEEAGTINRDTLPMKQIKQIQAFDGKIPWDDMQKLRSRLGAMVEAGNGTGVKDAVKLRARWAAQLREAIDETIENSDTLATKYPEAIESHHRMKTTFDRKSRAFKAFDSQDDEVRFYHEIADGRDGPIETRRVRDMLLDSPEALADFKAGLGRDTLLPQRGQSTPKAIEKRYLDRRTAMQELWTPEELRVFDEAVAAGIDTSVGKAGRRGMNYAPGSATQTIPDRNGFLPWVWNTAKNQATGSDRMANMVMEQFLMKPGELAPVLRAWKSGNRSDASRFVLMQAAKIASRSAAYGAPGMAVEQPLELGGEQ